MLKIKKKKFKNIGEIEKELQRRNILVCMWGCEDSEFWPYQWCMILKKFFGEVISFDPRKRKLQYGSRRMQEELYKIVEDKKPDFFIFLIESHEMNIDTIRKINFLSPQTKTIVHFGDDDLRFENRSRFYSLFTDYSLIPQVDKIPYYKKEGIKNAYPVIGANTENFKPLVLEKIYDVSLVGHPLPSRVEYLRLMKAKGIRVHLWGHGWHDYPEFSDIYKGALPTDDFINVVNQTKINLGFSKNHQGVPHFKGRVFDIAACKAFQLVDYFEGYKEYYREGKEIVMFTTKEELLEKIQYYLKHEREREAIAERAFRRTLKDNDYVVLFKKFFGKIIEEEDTFVRAPLPELKSKFIILGKEDLNKSPDDLQHLIAPYAYVGFKEDGSIFSEHKNYLQAYTLEKSKKEVGCCGYYAFSERLGNYFTFNVFKAMKSVKKENFFGLFNLQQFMVTRDYFMRNVEMFREIFLQDRIIDFSDEKNTSLITIPLLQIEKLSRRNLRTLRHMKGEELENVLQLNFIFELYVRLYQKRILFDGYLYKLLLDGLFKNRYFLLRSTSNVLSKKEIWAKMKEIVRKT